ncbi:hypothetical protein [Niveibacterium sp. SC-1]|uniref:hypothetical protein n=1 Tax=Niveibacterium sp. SC-1 TaxID=3135646 RepID=UPI003120470C
MSSRSAVLAAGEATAVPASSRLLRQALWVDFALSGASALMLVALPGLFARLTLLPEPLLLHAGQFLIAWSAVLFWILRRPLPNPLAVWGVIAVNLVWVLECALLLEGDQIAPNLLGEGYLLLNILSVSACAAAEFFGLRRVRAGS